LGTPSATEATAVEEGTGDADDGPGIRRGDQRRGLRPDRRHTVPVNLTGHPALSVPVGATDGEPVGAQFVGSRHDEVALVALGGILETHSKA
jgi:aspartyl-tRNA(Asn)/glutamyl-tRNA(Gln) amidotransferase subunit A